MNFDLEFERTYPHPIDKIWRALIDPEALAAWLMDTDFVPEKGRGFRMWCENEQGATDTYICSVVEPDPPHRIVWSWVLDAKQNEGETYVEFRLR